MQINTSLEGIVISFNFSKNSEEFKKNFLKKYKNFLSINKKTSKIKVFISFKDKEVLRYNEHCNLPKIQKKFIIKEGKKSVRGFKIMEDKKFLEMINYNQNNPLNFLILRTFLDSILSFLKLKGMTCRLPKPNKIYEDCLINFFFLHDLLNHFCNGLLVHGSGIFYRKKGLLFMGDSGTGKTTLSRFFNNKNVLCDDRILIKKIKNKYFMYSYIRYSNNSNKNQKIKSVPLHKIFFIGHGGKNIIKQLNLATASKKFLDHIIFFPKSNNSVFEKYKQTLEILKTVKCYNLKFIPTKSIKYKLDKIMND